VFQAAAEGGAGGSGFTTILFLLLLFGVVYFLMIRPQQKRRREALSMQNSLGPGDQIVTIGGLHGTVVSIDDDVATLEVAPGVVLTFARPAIARVLPRAEAVEETEEAPVETELAETGPVVEEQPVVVDDTTADKSKKD
jgi:preprotein translocase subunit YajC